MTIAETILKFNNTIKKQVRQSELSGFREVDNITHGWKPGELCIIGGRPAMGKTAFVLSVIRNMLNLGTPVALLTATDSANLMFLSRIACNLLDKETDWRAENNVKLLSDIDFSALPFYFYANPKLTIEFLRKTCTDLVINKGVKCIFIETIQALFYANDHSLAKGGMENICIELKQLAVELNVPVVVTSDLNRGPEHREGLDGKRPQIQDIRLSDAIENIADTIWFIFRPSYYRVYLDEKGNDLRNTSLVIIEKSKYGACGDARLIFNSSKCIFEDKAPDIF